MTGPVLEVDVDALDADGRRLESVGQPLRPSNAAPPGSDSVSLGAVRILNDHETALIDVLNYATRVREYGGAVIRSAAVAFELADRAGAESIRVVDDTGAPSIASPGVPLQMPLLPPVAHQPPIPTIPELPPLPSGGADQFAADVHSGPGASDLRDFSRTWHDYGRDIPHWADDTRSVGFQVSEHWSSGDTASHNVVAHAQWLDAAAASAERLSVAAESVAHAFDIAKQNTPTPDEFSAAESDVREAGVLMAVSPAIGIIEYNRATEHYADLYKKAEAAATEYHASVETALTAVGYPIIPCPSIASKADIPDIPTGPVRSGEVPPDVEYLADHIPGAAPGSDVTIGRRTKHTFVVGGNQYIGGDVFENKIGDLPNVDSEGAQVIYHEYDRYPYTPGDPRGAERIVIGTDGTRYFTDDHYKTFTKF